MTKKMSDKEADSTRDWKWLLLFTERQQRELKDGEKPLEIITCCLKY